MSHALFTLRQVATMHGQCVGGGRGVWMSSSPTPVSASNIQLDQTCTEMSFSYNNNPQTIRIHLFRLCNTQSALCKTRTALAGDVAFSAGLANLFSPAPAAPRFITREMAA